MAARKKVQQPPADLPPLVQPPPQPDPPPKRRPGRPRRTDAAAPGAPADDRRAGLRPTPAAPAGSALAPGQAPGGGDGLEHGAPVTLVKPVPALDPVSKNPPPSGVDLHFSPTEKIFQPVPELPDFAGPTRIAAAAPPALKDAELERLLQDQSWRLDNLYTIVTEETEEIPFVMNPEQRDLWENRWWRNIVLKARQLGFTTFLDLLALDCCVFTRNFSATVIAHTLNDAEKIFRTKVAFPFEQLRKILPVTDLAKETGSEYVFRNGSSIAVTTSARSATVQFLHISEFGKVCAKFPDRAEEIVTGSFPAAQAGMTFIESTAEGQAGYFYDYSMEALRREESGKRPNRLQYRLHFYPWWTKEAYQLDDPSVLISQEMFEYFERLRKEERILLSPAQQRWYVTMEEVLQDKMKREYPSYPREAFEVAIDGAVYGRQMTRMRREGRICDVPFLDGLPVNTYWDLGQRDKTAVWFHQRAGLHDRFFRYMEMENRGIAWWAEQLQKLPYVYGTHYLPHDADHKTQGDRILPESKLQIFQRLMPGQYFEIVPKVQDLSVGIDLVRTLLNGVVIDRTHCVEGIKALDGYTYVWNEKTNTYSEEPVHNAASNGADAFRQWAQVYSPPELGGAKKGVKRYRQNWRS